jgi:thiol-disulfide isomerase/thioredoxin
MKNLAFWIGAAALISGVIATASGTGDEGRMPDLDGATAWLNSAPLRSKSLRGKVVLVNFWTYSCINSLRELPYINAWAAKYKDAGLLVIGVHSPEFGFEKDPANVKNAVSELRIGFPVPIDSDHAIWSAFHNEYWPADYFIDRRGRIRAHHFGEGEYEKSERVIQELLGEDGGSSVNSGPVSTIGTGVEAPPSEDVQSPETYAGYARTERFASRARLAYDARRTYTPPLAPALNQWGLAGGWNVGAERSALQAAPGKVVFRFHARDFHMVLGTAKNGSPVRFKVTLDGAEPGDDHGVDSGPDGSGEVREPRLYQLIRQEGEVHDRTFAIEFLDDGVQVFSFTFG